MVTAVFGGGAGESKEISIIVSFASAAGFLPQNDCGHFSKTPSMRSSTWSDARMVIRVPFALQPSSGGNADKIMFLSGFLNSFSPFLISSFVFAVQKGVFLSIVVKAGGSFFAMLHLISMLLLLIYLKNINKCCLNVRGNAKRVPENTGPIFNTSGIRWLGFDKCTFHSEDVL